MAIKWILFGAVILMLNSIVVVNSTNDCTFNYEGGTETDDLSLVSQHIKHPKQNMTTNVRWGSDNITEFNVREF